MPPPTLAERTLRLLSRVAWQVLLHLALPLVLARLAWRARQAPGYGRQWWQRFGIGLPPAPPPGAIWVHAVSAGESIAAAPLVEALLAERPGRAVAVSNMTPTGAARVQALLGSRVLNFWAPYDHFWACWLTLRWLRPAVLVVMETELWPGLLRAARRTGVPVVVANARLSARSARGYGRLGPLVRSMFEDISLVACQYPAHAERFLALGAAPDQVQVLGNIKFEPAVPGDVAAQAAAWRSRWGDRPVLLAASTHDNEEQQLLDQLPALQQAMPGLLLVLVPRHPERFAPVLAAARAVAPTVQASTGAPIQPGDQVLVVDAMGQLMGLYGAADLAFVGGSLVPRGGHNVIEPAWHGTPVLCGPHMFNFTDVVELFLAEAGLLQVQDAEALVAEVARLWADPARRQALGEAGQKVVTRHAGACGRVAAAVSAQVG